VPYHTTWQHEKDHDEPDDSKFITVENLTGVLDIL
jgi:hypothetical protein